MKNTLKRNIEQSAKAEPVQVAQKAATTRSWSAPDPVAMLPQKPVAAPKPSGPKPAAEKEPAPTKMSATVLAELARIAAMHQQRLHSKF